MERQFTPIIVESEYTYPQYRRFFVFNFFRGKHYQLNQLLDFLGMPLLYLLIKVMTYWQSKTLTFGLFDFLYGAFYLLLILYVVVAPQLYFRQAKATANVSMTMEFDHESFSIRFNGPISSGNSSFLYTAIYKIYELPQDYYIYISSSQAYLLDKGSLTSEENERLRRLLTEKTNASQYVLCKGLPQVAVEA